MSKKPKLAPRAETKTPTPLPARCCDRCRFWVLWDMKKPIFGRCIGPVPAAVRDSWVKETPADGGANCRTFVHVSGSPAARLLTEILAITGATQDRPYTALSLIDDLARRAQAAMEADVAE